MSSEKAIIATSPFLMFAHEYRQTFLRAVENWDLSALERMAEVLSAARARGARVLICGNGGSAAIANHAECDCSKGTERAGAPPLDTRSLSANPSILTAIGNDLGYAAVFEKQIDLYGRAGDVALIVSSKGNSPNVIAACKAAQERGLVTLALVGFEGGALAGLADHVVHIPVDNYGIVEDMHQACVHLVTQFLASG